MDGNLSKVKLCSTSVKQVRKNPCGPGEFRELRSEGFGEIPEDFREGW